MLILASASPRRRELLSLITADFEVCAAGADETVPAAYTPEQTVLELARRKALATNRTDGVVISADTVVALREPPDGAWEILGKPESRDHAAKMLRKLSGRVHTVYTGVAISARGNCECFAESAQVEFSPLSEEQIQAYVDTGEPMDKAGAYGIQGKGALFIRGIAGDFYTVMGLPVCRLYETLRDKFGLDMPL